MAENESSENKKSFQVVDKRRFDSAGHERGEASATQPATAHEEKKTESAGHFRMEDSNTTEHEVTFSSFVMSLATQAMVQLGQMAPPPGMEIPVDIESGKGTIDILGMIQRKTRGNLSKEEDKFLEDILHTLRVSYVKRVKSS
jgi:hypothetical protein